MRLSYKYLTPTIFFLSACAGDLEPTDNGEGNTDFTDSKLDTATEQDGSYLTRVDATAEEAWVYFDFESAAEVRPDTPEDSDEWDVAFQRNKVKLNSGPNGSGTVQVAPLQGAGFAEVSEAPAGGYVVDTEKDGEVELALEGEHIWYNYDITTHTLTPREIVYVFKSLEGGHFKLAFESYYDDAGTSGFLSFTWAEVDAPDVDTLSVDASASDSWVYLDASNGEVVSVSEPQDSDAWDLGFQRTYIRTNSGVSGDGLGGARKANMNYEVVTSAPTTGFTEDQALEPLPHQGDAPAIQAHKVLSNWYNYANQTVSSKEETYLIRTAGGEYAKLQILDYSSGVYDVRLETVPRQVVDVTTDVNASDDEKWVYLNRRSGEFVEPSEPKDSKAWDLGFKSTMMRTNSGTSGDGDGGAIAPEGADALSAISTAPQSGYTVDEMLPVPGPPGSGDFSGNPVLDEWFNYDFETHVVSPKEKAFALRLADGGYARLQVLDYEDGTLKIRWSYAGKGQTQF